MDIPAAGQSEAEAARPKRTDLMPATADNLLFAFRRCHNYIAGNQGLQKSQAFWELLKLIFCKIHDERHNDEVEFYAAANERHGINGPLKVQKRIDNLFNQVNPKSVSNDYGPTPGDAHAIFLTPLSWYANRQVQLGVHWKF